jgi:hypothetical protein
VLAGKLHAPAASDSIADLRVMLTGLLSIDVLMLCCEM